MFQITTSLVLALVERSYAIVNADNPGRVQGNHAQGLFFGVPP